MSSAKSDPPGPAPVPPPTGAGPRPFWSVMVPTYNCAALLRQTLASVLAQDPGPDRMQVEVVDDVSTADDPEAVVREVGGGRVGFFRHPTNVGATPNFNACLARARGEWVHLLHGDDWVLPGFYAAVERAVAGRDVAMAFTRSLLTDEGGNVDHITPRTPELEGGGRAFPPLHAGNPIQTPSVVVRRAFYERHGGFDPQFPHVADWEMWLRATSLGGAVAVNHPLACYRSFAGNHTGRLARTAENLADYVRLARSAEAAGRAAVDWPRFRRFVAGRAAAQAELFARLGDRDAARANWRFWRQWVTPGGRAEYWGRRLLLGGR